MNILPTEPVGSIPRSDAVIRAGQEIEKDWSRAPEFEPIFDAAVQDTIARFIATGSPIITDGEQRKHRNFITYCVDGSPSVDGEGFGLAFDAGHVRQLPRVVRGPLRYQTYADSFVRAARRHTRHPLKQAIIAPSALSLLYPAEDLPDYSRRAFLNDLVREHLTEIRLCLAAGAASIQADFTEGRLALKLDASGALLRSFIDLNNMALDQLTGAERRVVGIHTCPGSDCDSHHSADVDYRDFLPELFRLNAGRFFIAMACEADRERALALVAESLRPGQTAYIGVINPVDPAVENPEQVRDRVLEAARFIPLNQLGTTDDCGFSPFYDDRTTSRDTAFAKIKARIDGTRLAQAALSG